MPPARRSARTASSTLARESAQPYTRANRQSSPNTTRPTASIARPANGKTSLRLTVKAPPSKLRQATSGSQIAAPIPPNPYADNPSESDATPAPAGRTARSTRNPRKVVEPESEEEDDGDAEGEEEDVDQELLAHEDSEEDAEVSHAWRPRWSVRGREDLFLLGTSSLRQRHALTCQSYPTGRRR